MQTDDNLKALIEAIIYVAPDPVTLDAIVKSLEGETRERVREKLEELLVEYQLPMHGIEIRQVAGGYKFASKPEHHEVLRKFVKSLKPLVRLSKPALETLAVIAYRQPVTMPEIEAIRGVDCGGVIHTLMEKKLVVTSGRKNVVGRPILYRTSRDFLVHFGLKDVSELPSLKEFEELARQALGSELLLGGETSAPTAPVPEGEAVTSPEASAEVIAEEGTPAEASEESPALVSEVANDTVQQGDGADSSQPPEPGT